MVEPIHTAPKFGRLVIDLWGCGCWWNNCYWEPELSTWVHHKLGVIQIEPSYWAPVPPHRKGIRYGR